MDDRETGALAALPAILTYLLNERRPSHDDTDDPKWRELFQDANYFAERFGAVYARSQRD